jgi:hypothetical protein
MLWHPRTPFFRLTSDYGSYSRVSDGTSWIILHPQLAHCHCSECRDDLPHVNMKHARLGYERDAPDAHDGLMNRVCATSMRFSGN